MTMNNRDWDKAWFYLHNDDEQLPAYTGKVLTEKPDSWGYGVSPPERQAKLVASEFPRSWRYPTSCANWRCPDLAA